jgi:4-hydroxysphinganine ceramide fatty acyl 2-hydroxylase
MPDRPFFLMLHFLLHGIHHYLPMDRYVVPTHRHLQWIFSQDCSLRLVMPPILFGALQMPFTRLAYVLFPTAVANGIISGAFAFCKPYTYLIILAYGKCPYTSAIHNRRCI